MDPSLHAGHVSSDPSVSRTVVCLCSRRDTCRQAPGLTAAHHTPRYRRVSHWLPALRYKLGFHVQKCGVWLSVFQCFDTAYTYTHRANKLKTSCISVGRTVATDAPDVRYTRPPVHSADVAHSGQRLHNFVHLALQTPLMASKQQRKQQEQDQQVNRVHV